MIWKVGRPTPGHRAPTKICTASQVFHLCVTIPRCAHVKLCICIVGKRLAICIEGYAVRISHSGTKDFLVATISIHAQHMPLVIPEGLELFSERGGSVGDSLRQFY